MKKLSAIAMALSLLFMASPAAYLQAMQTTTSPPPVAPTLVREGDFAIRLVSLLELGTAENETEAETMLAAAGIAPKNGWISDYPITPDILGELQDAVADAADSDRLPMGKDEALEVLASVSEDVGLYVIADTSEQHAETPASTSPEYTEPTVINNYYYREGPPVVTYYPPPPDYLYLYAWVPYPFWCSSFFFSGFFILHDFHKVSIIHQRGVVVTNHVFHRQHRRFYLIDPVRRRKGRSLRPVARRTHRRPLFTAEARRGARSILRRSHDRMASQRRPVKKKVAIVKWRRRPTGQGQLRHEIPRQNRASNDRSRVRAQTSPRREVQGVHKDSARSFGDLGRRRGRSSGPTSKGEPRFSGTLRKGSRAFSGKVSRRISAGSGLKGSLMRSFRE